MRGHDAYRGIQASSGSQNDAAVVRLLVPVRMNACRSSITAHANGMGLCSGRSLFVRVLHQRDFSLVPPRTQVLRRVVTGVGCPQGAVGLVWRLSSTRKNHIAEDRHFEVLGSRVPDLPRDERAQVATALGRSLTLTRNVRHTCATSTTNCDRFV